MQSLLENPSRTIRVNLFVCMMVLLLSGCRSVKPRRFSNLHVIPAPVSSLVLPKGQFSPLPLPGTSPEAAMQKYVTDMYSSAGKYRKNPIWLHGTGFGSTGLFCENCNPGPRILATTVIAGPAPATAPEVKLPAFLRMAGRAQAEAVKGYFAGLPRATKSSDALDGLAKFLNDGKDSPKPANPGRPRVELTISQLLTLPGEWERLQYLSVFFVLHSGDVRFADTNEFENLLREIELGKLTETSTSGISATGGIGFGNSPPTAAVSRPGNVSVTADTRYTEALERQIKEQLQFRATSLDLNGRILSVVLKSSQTNKLPTMIRPVFTLQYAGSLEDAARSRIFRPEYQQGKLAAFSFQDQVKRNPKLMTASDLNSMDAATWFTKATPIVVGVVRRVRNAKGVNTSVEDDDDVEYTTQAEVLEPVTLDSPSKCEYNIVAGPSNEFVYVLGPGEADAKQATFVDSGAARRFRSAIRERIDAKLNLTDGLIFNETTVPTALSGFRILRGTNPLDANNKKDWTGIDLGGVMTMPPCK